MEIIDLHDRVAIVTGASTGIGSATARALAREGCHVVLASRRADKIQAVAHNIQVAYNVRALAIPTDLSQSSQIDALVQKAETELGGIDILVNNAGVGLYGRVDEVNENELRYVFEVNFFAVVHAIQSVTPAMRRRNGGTIVNVSSVAGKFAIPQMGKTGASGGYSASKFALQAISSAARMELARDGIHVITVCPGRTRTDFNRNVRVGVPELEHTIRSRRSLLPSIAADRVAEAIVRSIKSQEREVFVRRTDRLMVGIANSSPGLFERLISNIARRLDTPRSSAADGMSTSALVPVLLAGATLLSALLILRWPPFRYRSYPGGRWNRQQRQV